MVAKPVGKIKKLDIDAAIAYEKELASLPDVITGGYRQANLTKVEWSSYAQPLQNTFKFGNGYSDSFEIKYGVFANGDVSVLSKVYLRALEGKADIWVYHVGEEFILVRYSQKGNVLIVVPKQFCEIEAVKDDLQFLYSLPQSCDSLPVARGNSVPELISQVSVAKEEMLKNQSAIAKAETELREKEKALRAELDRQLEVMRKEMQVHLDALEIKKEEFARDYFKLEVQIDYLRSLIGDNYRLLHLRKGALSELETPLVIFQKLHYLDEDFARLRIMAGTDAEDLFNYDNFDDAIAKEDFLFEYFCPSEKCVSVVKVSADQTQYVVGVDNMLKSYEVENGHDICILVRDGQSLYGLWCEEGITIKENLIPSSQEEPIDTTSGWDGQPLKIREIRFRARELIARKTIYDILTGLAEYRNPPIIRVEGSFTVRNSRIIYSVADSWLDDGRPDFAKFVRDLNLKTKVGDYILPLDRISGYYEQRNGAGRVDWVDNRGRGDNALAHDASIPNKVVQVNLVETESTSLDSHLYDRFPGLLDYPKEHPELLEQLLAKLEKAYSYRYGYPSEAIVRVPCPDYQLHEWTEEERQPKLYHKTPYEKDLARSKRKYAAYFRIWTDSAGVGYCWKPESHIGRDGTARTVELKRGYGRYKASIHPQLIVKTILEPEEYGIYVSCEKTYSDKGARANISIDHSEFLNLTYVSSETIMYYISSKKLGTAWGKNFASNVSTLKKALDFVRKREQEVMIILNRTASKLLDEKEVLAKLYKWQLDNEVRIITDFQARRFLKSVGVIS